MECRFARALAIMVFTLSALQPALAGSMRTVNGQSYWEMDPGPVTPDAYWAGNAEKYDPHNYLSQVNREAQRQFDETLYAEHEGRDRCVWRKRVVNSNWEYMHPFVRVCRR